MALSFIIGNLTSQKFDIKGSISSKINVLKPESTQNAQTSTSSPIAKNYKTIYKKVGDSFALGNIEYQIVSTKNKGSEYGYQTTTGKYIVLEIKATNVGKQESGLANIYLQDNKGRKYERNEFLLDFSSKLNEYGRTKNYNGIPAGFSESFVAAFEVPKDSTGLKLNYPSTEGNVILSVDLGF